VKAVSISLVDADHIYLKSKVGLEYSVTDRHSSFAAHAILPQYPDLFEVKNALEDGRFSNNFRVVGFPYWRFYAGVALIGKGNQKYYIISPLMCLLLSHFIFSGWNTYWITVYNGYESQIGL